MVSCHERGWGFAMRQGGCNGDMVLLVEQSLVTGNSLWSLGSAGVACGLVLQICCLCHIVYLRPVETLLPSLLYSGIFINSTKFPLALAIKIHFSLK